MYENLYEMFSSSEVAFLGNVIAQFQKVTGKSVNYHLFSVHNYFEMVPSECWPNKKEIMESISHHLPKSLVSWWLAKQEFDKWWLKSQSKFFINIFIFACFRIFHQTHDSTFFWMSPKFLACDTSWSHESIFRNITFPIPIENRFCGRNHFFCQSFQQILFGNGLSKTPVPFLLFQTQP